MELADSLIKDSFPFKEQMLMLYGERLRHFKRLECCHIYNSEGMKEFLATGSTTDLNVECFNSLTGGQRKMIESKLRNCGEKHSNIELTSDILKIPEQLGVICFDNGNILVSYANPDYPNQRLIMKERSMYKSMMNFMEYLRYEAEKKL